MIFLIFRKSGHQATFSGTRSWEGLTARGGLDGPHLGHPLRRDQVRGSSHDLQLTDSMLTTTSTTWPPVEKKKEVG